MEEACVELVRELGPRHRFQGVVAISRGGMVPAGLVVRLLDTRFVDTLCITTYDDRVRVAPRLVKGIEGDGAGLLVVDDVADSGVTLALVRRLLPKAHIAAFYVKPAGRPFVDSYARAVDQDVWIVFPWEAFEQRQIAGP
jgi:xanthine phosphoribosyltransferase